MSGETPSLRPKRKAAFDNEDEDDDDEDTEQEVKKRKLVIEDSPVKKEEEGIADNQTEQENDESDEDSDDDGTKVSDDMADACKTACKICHQIFTLTNMRNHTSKEHNIQITKYKSIYGNFHEDFSMIIEIVYHKCHLCGKLVLLDSDRLGGHIKGVHKMTERDYKAQYMKGAPLGPKSTSTPSSKMMLTPRRKAYDVDRDKFKFVDSEESLALLLSEMEYDCNIADCTSCGL